jgi:hypothetical protein
LNLICASAVTPLKVKKQKSRKGEKTIAWDYRFFPFVFSPRCPPSLFEDWGAFAPEGATMKENAAAFLSWQDKAYYIRPQTAGMQSIPLYYIHYFVLRS